MSHITKLNDLIDKKLSNLDHKSNKVEVLYDKDAQEYVEIKGIKKETKDCSGYIDIDSYFSDAKKPIVVLVFNSNDRFAYGTIAHELEHAKQLLEGRILSNNDRGKFKG